MALDLDMTEIHQVFFEESAEGLDIMESGLLNLDVGAADADVMNDIFRAAHSIKGGAATFGFLPISEFTHHVETLLDQMRSGEREVTKEAVEVLLKGVDCLRAMLECVQADEVINTEKSDGVTSEIEAILGIAGIEGSEAGSGKNAGEQEVKAAPPPAPKTGPTADESETTEKPVATWVIDFSPHPGMLQTNNDPIRIFRELATLGNLEVKVNADDLPEFEQVTAQDCYLSWQLTLEGRTDEEEIVSVFGFVEEECDLEVECLQPAIEEAQKVQKAEVSTVEAVQAVPKPARAAKAKRPESGSIRVAIDKIDSIINLVGELVITQSMLNQAADTENAEPEHMVDNLSQLTRNTRELQESVMRIRMLPISFSFSRFPRLVHDMCTQLSKKIELEVHGETTELDKTVLEKMSDPLVHLVRNSIDHGIESPEKRLAAGKPEVGHVSLNAYHEGGSVVIEVKDDGGGLPREKIRSKAIERGLLKPDEEVSDERIYNMIFHPGLSTAEKVSDLSGRGVGLDVVKRNITDLGGHIGIDSEEGQGTKISIRLPLTLAILDGQLVRVGEETFVVSLVSIVESVQIDTGRILSIAGKGEVYKLRDEYIPILHVHDLLDIAQAESENEGGLLVVVESDGLRVGLQVDELKAQQQVVIKSLETNYKEVLGISGATILGDGTVALIMDVAGMLELFQHAKETEDKTEDRPETEVA